MKNFIWALFLSVFVVVAHGASNITSTTSSLTINTTSGAVTAPPIAKTNVTFPGSVTSGQFIGNATSATSSTHATNLYGRHFPTVKAAFSTNYTVSTNDAILFCTGTNQIITMPDCTVAPTAFMLTVVTSTTTGSVIVTNVNGSQTILGLASLTNAAATRVTLINDGANYW
jgi:hypothetical protein